MQLSLEIFQTTSKTKSKLSCGATGNQTQMGTTTRSDGPSLQRDSSPSLAEPTL